MKLRIGFVSNSSSASFAICKSMLSEETIEKLHKLFSEAEDGDWSTFTNEDDSNEYWVISEDENSFHGTSTMDNDILHNKILEIIPNPVVWCNEG